MLGRSFLKWGEINRPATPIHWCWFWRNTGVSLSHAPFLFSASCALPNTFNLWPRSSRTPSLQSKIPGLLTVSHSAPSLTPLSAPGPICWAPLTRGLREQPELAVPGAVGAVPLLQTPPGLTSSPGIPGRPRLTGPRDCQAAAGDGHRGGGDEKPFWVHWGPAHQL